MFRVKHSRPDGTFVIEMDNGWPYHVTRDDQLFEQVANMAEGLNLDPEPEIQVPQIVPQIVSRFQMIEALIDTPSPVSGFENANAWVDYITNLSGGRVRRAYLSAPTFERNSPTVAALQQQAGWSASDVDQLFIKASGISA